MAQSTSRSRLRGALFATTAVSLALGGAAAQAQDADEAGDDGATRDRILVTSQKRAEAVAVQDLPVALTAFDSTAIEDSFSVDLRDLGRYAPNVQLTGSATFVGFPNFYIRGIGINGSTRTVDPAVGVFVNGIYMGFAPATLLDTFDLEAVEVLRGPQGTLFGRNVTGGAVSVRTKRPTDEFGVSAKAVVGSFDRLDAFAAVNIPFSDKVRARFSVISQNQDGYWEDNNGGFVDTDINPDGLPDTATGTKPDVDTAIFRPTIEFDLSENVDLTLTGEYYVSKNGASNSRNIIHPDGRLAQTQFGFIPPDDPYEINHNLLEDSDIEIWHISGEGNYDLGHGVATLLAGYREVVKFDTSTDFDGTPFSLFHFPDNEEEQDQVSLELRYASNFSERFEFTTGVYYFDQSYFVGEGREILEVIRQAGVTELDHQIFAGFGQGEYRFNDQWALTLGGRYTYEEKEILFSPPGTCELDYSSCTETFTASDSWGNFTPRVALHYQPNDDLLVYGSFTRGFRSGTFNQRAQRLEALGPADEETVTAYEIGAKTTLLGGAAVLNVAGFYSDYDDIQQIVNNTFDPDGPDGPLPESSEQILANAASARIFGVELEGSAQLTENFRIDGSLGYVNAEFQDFEGLDFDLDGDEDADDSALASTLEFARVPEFTGHIAAEYRWPVTTGDIAARGGYTYTDDFFTDLRNDPVIGHLRFLLEGVGPKLRQYIVEHNTEGRPFNRDTRTLVYQRAQGL
ncbi:MAG: TonB-dependent receptor, partial [Caulobacterales bacterium]|nr:TonB-dependent receptor [Caulobacterales bacterium]